METPITFRTDFALTADQFISVLNRATLGERRPVNDLGAIQKMVAHADLWTAAWNGEQPVGVARSLTDFAFCCYMSDLAVDVAFQKRGIGRQLIALTRSMLGPDC